MNTQKDNDKDVVSIIILILLAILTIAAVFCIIQNVISYASSFDYAIVSLPNGEIISGQVDNYHVCNNGNIILTINGTTYLTNSNNVVLINNNKNEDTN